MPTLLTTGFLAFLLCLFLTPGLRSLLARSLPRGTVPRMGGLAVLAAAGLALAIPAWFHLHFAGLLDSRLLRQLALPALIVLAVGVVDDHWSIRPAWKFSGQTLAAALVISHGIRVTAIFHHSLPFWVGALITIFWLVGCSNAFNLIDGLDGLATGLALFATATVLAHAVLVGEPDLALITTVLFGALAAFLLFNFPPASIYLGDAGSLSIGFLLGSLALVWADKANTAVGLMAPFFAVLVPVTDTLVAITRRALSGRPVFTGDKSHIHHRLLGRGATPRAAVLILYGVAGAGAVASLLLADMRQRHSFELVILLFVVLAGVGIQQLRFTEFSEIGRMVRHGSWDPRPGIQARLALRHWQETVGQAADYAAVWDGLRQLARELGFETVELRVGPQDAPLWQRALPTALSASMKNQAAASDFCGWLCQAQVGPAGILGRVRLWRSPGDATPILVEDLAEVLQAQLAPHLQQLRASTPPQATAHAAGV